MRRLLDSLRLFLDSVGLFLDSLRHRGDLARVSKRQVTVAKRTGARLRVLWSFDQ
jgi:hypothetical protein